MIIKCEYKMSEIFLVKTESGDLSPADQQSVFYVAKLKVGSAVRAKVVRENNIYFHRKLFALFNLGFDSWEPTELEYKGEKVAKEFNQFRNNITILAGYYETSINLNGKLQLTAKSLKFGKMDHDEREKLYSAVIDVILQKVLPKYTRNDLENVINKVLSFA